MESISPSELALELLNYCLRGGSWPADLLETLMRCALHPEEARAREGTHALFGIVVERLADLFEPALCDTYAALFCEAMEFVYPEMRAQDLLARYRRVRMARPFAGAPDRVKDVFVLSRVTLGADVAVTSIILDAVKQRFPLARIHFVGTRKGYELFAGDERVLFSPVQYGRTATLRDRLAVWPELRAVLGQRDSIVVDPDSRLTQLGILPVCGEENYYFFESRSFGEYGPESLAELTKRWVRGVFGVEDARAYVAVAGGGDEGMRPAVAVSLGVGENPAKRVRDPFEVDLLRALAARGGRVAIDRGFGGEERQRVDRAVEGLGGCVTAMDGSFAEFASVIGRSELYVGYDSAGQHVAAALGVPLVAVFSGFVSARMLNRWRPSGPGAIAVVPVHDPHADLVLAETLRAIERVAG